MAYVSDLPYTAVANGWGPVEKDTNNGEQTAGDGHTVTYAKGLGVHTDSKVDVPLNGAYSTFQANIGIDDEVLPNTASPVDFQVWADGVKLFDSGNVTNASAIQSVNVDVTGRSRLALKVIHTGYNICYDYSGWACARLLPGPSDPPASPPPSGSTVSITPTALTALLSNPGMGLETFYRTSATDPNNGILPLGAAYTRYTSSSYESSRGDFSFTRMVNDYNAARARGQDYTFRIMPYEDVEGGPGWLRALGVCRSPGLAGRDCPGPASGRMR